MDHLQNFLAANLNRSLESMQNALSSIQRDLMSYADQKFFENLFTISQDDEILKIRMDYFGEVITSSYRFSFTEDKKTVIYFNFHNTSNENVLHLQISHVGRVHAPQTSGFGEFDYNDSSLPAAIIEEILYKKFGFQRQQPSY